jgi:hypothetical protein
VTMPTSWNTKFGSRRVKEALPTIDEALAAAACMNDDPEQQVEIAASLLGIGLDEVREVARKAPPRIKPRLSVPLMGERSHSPRPVVVEYRAAKRLVAAR